MWKQIPDLIARVFGLTRDMEEGKAVDKKHSQEIKELQEEVRLLAATVERYHYEQQLNHQQTTSDLKNALLQIEVMLMKSERLLPPAPKEKLDKPDEDK